MESNWRNLEKHQCNQTLYPHGYPDKRDCIERKSFYYTFERKNVFGDWEHYKTGADGCGLWRLTSNGIYNQILGTCQYDLPERPYRARQKLDRLYNQSDD